MDSKRVITALPLLAGLLLAPEASGQAPLGTAFTYQGRLTDSGTPASGTYDLQFKLFDAVSGGNQIGSALTKTSVPVSSGLFTVSLDFGAAAFAGSGRWLEIGVRPGGTSGSFTVLAGRQELTPAPNAVFSATTGDPSVQRRTVPPTCAVGQYIRSIAADGTPTCATDADTNSGGTVTSVGSGAGLTGGPISGSGTLSVATGGIVSAMIANGAVGQAQINQAEVQTRVGGTCPSNQFLRGINPDGTVICGWIVSLSVVDGGGSVDAGRYTSVKYSPMNAIRIISYQDVTNTSLKVRGSNIFVIDNSGDVGAYASLAIAADDTYVVSYQDLTLGALKVASCTPSCFAPTVTTIDDPATGTAGAYTSIAIGADALPVIAYEADLTIPVVRVAHCGSATCQSGNSIASVGPGTHTSLAIGADGFPVVAYQRGSPSLALWVTHCTNVACTTTSPPVAVDDPANLVGSYTSITIGTDSLPIISYYDETAFALKVAHCGNALCTAGNAATTVDDPANHVGKYTSITIGTDGLALISYFDETAGTLKVAHCGNAPCSAGNTVATVDSTPGHIVGLYSSITISPQSGFPVVSYYDQTAGTLKVVNCGNATCQ